ncbi:MAG: nucleotide excision repair endonuclease [Myxococcota bacterium]
MESRSLPQSMKRFDRKFGVNFLRELPESPGCYVFRDAAGDVLYVGKAKNLRKRLSSYRSASRRKAHRKMRVLVREADAVETRLTKSEADALLLENKLIQELRPRFNVDGAFDFLYPAFGTGLDEGRLLLCFTTEPESFAHLDLEWHGAFRPRTRAKEAFDSLVDLLGWLGHLEPANRLPDAPRIRGSRLVALRRVHPDLLPPIRGFLDGQNDTLLETLCDALLERSGARGSAAEVGEALRFLGDFYRHDICRLLEARESVGETRSFIPREERDGLFIRSRALANTAQAAPPPRTDEV